MSDFLRNLRNSRKKDNSDPRRNLDGHYYPKENRRQNMDRRSTSSGNLETLLISIQDLLPQLAENSSEISQLFKQFIHNNDLMTHAHLKQMTAVTQFFDNLNTIFTKDFSEPDERPTKRRPKASSGYVVGNNYTKNDILEIIKTMRKEGSTFALIAAYLTDKKIPTFSGKGEWHAQTIHRLCK